MQQAHTRPAGKKPWETQPGHQSAQPREAQGLLACTSWEVRNPEVSIVTVVPHVFHIYKVNSWQQEVKGVQNKNCMWPGMEAHTCHPDTGEAEAGGSL